MHATQPVSTTALLSKSSLSSARLLQNVRYFISLGLVVAGACQTASASQASDIERLRNDYQQAQTYLDNKDVKGFQSIRSSIEGYALTPYTDYRMFLIDIGKRTPSEVSNFIEQHKTFPFSNRIQAPYLDALAKTEQWSRFLEFQPDSPRTERYVCHYYRAQYETGNQELAYNGAGELWLSGSGVDDACDPLFDSWSKAGLRTDEAVIDRMLLAFENRNGSLLKYLSKLMESDRAKQQASEMIQLFQKPEQVAKFAKKHSSDEGVVLKNSQTQVELALKKLARKDIEVAQADFAKTTKSIHLSTEQQQTLAEYLAFRLINTESEELAQWRDNIIEKSKTNTLLERRSRLAIQHANWQGLQKWISLLSDAKQDSLRWQYWQGRAEVALGDVNKGTKRLESMVGKRNYYSVAAANAIKQSIQYPTSTITFNKQQLNQYLPSLARIQELIAVDKITAAKSEWRWLLARSSQTDKEMLAAYAANENWHHLTVTATISAKMWDYTELRFPVAHKWWFNFYADKYELNPITLMSLARQESALDVDARSPVGARGLMQIMPTTAKYTANKYQLTYSGADELYEVGKNIEIGSQYLQSLLKQYDGNRIFAFAAYNAGPNRVKLWRSRSNETLDVYAFIEAIPFKETRGYVQNILMFETYYRDIMNVDGPFLSNDESRLRY